MFLGSPHVACAERGDSERKHGVCGGGGDPCGISQTFLHLAKSAHDLDRRGIRINCGLSTFMTTHARCHWYEDRSELRDSVIVNRYSCVVRLLWCGPESAVSTTALPNNKGQHTLQYPMLTSTLRALLVLVHYFPDIAITCVIGIC